jgi:hypothetical protein
MIMHHSCLNAWVVIVDGRLCEMRLASYLDLHNCVIWKEETMEYRE